MIKNNSKLYCLIFLYILLIFLWITKITCKAARIAFPLIALPTGLSITASIFAKGTISGSGIRSLIHILCKTAVAAIILVVVAKLYISPEERQRNLSFHIPIVRSTTFLVLMWAELGGWI